MIAGGNQENISFLIDVQQYRRLKKSDRAAAAHDIISTYLAQNALHPLNVSSDQRQNILAQVCLRGCYSVGFAVASCRGHLPKQQLVQTDRDGSVKSAVGVCVSHSRMSQRAFVGVK